MREVMRVGESDGGVWWERGSGRELSSCALNVSREMVSHADVVNE